MNVLGCFKGDYIAAVEFNGKAPTLTVEVQPRDTDFLATITVPGARPKQLTGTYLWGFVSFAVLALVMLVMLRLVQIRWTRTWAEKGGRARPMPAAASSAAGTTASKPAMR